MENQITLNGIKNILLKDCVHPLDSSCFLQLLFLEILEKSYIQKRMISSASFQAFLNGNIKINKDGNRSYANFKTTRILKEKLLCKDIMQLEQNETFHRMAYNLEQILVQSSVPDWHIAIQNALSSLTAENTYYPAFYEALKLLQQKKKEARALAAMVALAIFQETLPEIFPWLQPSAERNTSPVIRTATYSSSNLTNKIRQTAMQMLNTAAEEQGRMLAFRSVKHKIDMPDVGNILSTALGVQNNHIHSMLVKNEDNTSESLHSLFAAPPYNNIMLTGVGGSGKTFMLLDLGESLLQNDSPLIPVYIPLNLLNRNSIGDQCNPIVHYFSQCLGEKKPTISADLLHWMKTEQQSILFFLLDGYNEITSEIAKNNLILEIKAMKRLFPAARFLITSRNNLSECFSTGRELPFFCKQVNPLQDTHIKLFLKRQFGKQKAEQEWRQLISTKFIDILRNPMALAMYAYTLQNDSLLNVPLPYPKPETIGELIGNFIEQVKRTPTLNGSPAEQEQTEYTMQILYYISYCMARSGSFRMDAFSIRSTLEDAISFYRQLPNCKMSPNFTTQFWDVEKKMGFLIYPQHADQDYRFYHQNFRDYFYANFLLGILQTALRFHTDYQQTQEAKKLICHFFSEPIPNEILQFLGEVTLERLYLPGENQMQDGKRSLLERALQILRGVPADGKTRIAIDQLITAAKRTRHQNLSTFCFDGLDLQSVNLNGVRLYDIGCGRLNTASFLDTHLTEYTFQPLGHSAAVHTFCTIGDTLLSISGSGIWCYHTPTQQFRFAASYDGTFVTGSTYTASHKLLLTGDKNGRLCFWQYTEQPNGTLSFQMLPERTLYLQNAIQQIVIDETQDCCFAAVKNMGIWRIPLCKPDSRTFVAYTEAQKGHRKYKIALVKQFLIFSCGKTLYRIPTDAAGFQAKQTTVFLPITAGLPESEVAYIYDFKSILHFHQTCFLINLRGKHTSVILLSTPNGCFDIQRKQHTDQFSGFNDIILSPESSKFCICNKIYGNREACITEVQLPVTGKDFVCKPYYGNQNFEIETACYLNPDEIMLSSLDRSLQIINTCTESIRYHFLGYDAGIHALFPVSETALYTSSYDGTLHHLSRDWLTGKWHCVQSIPAHRNWVYQVKYFMLGETELLASCSHDHTIRIWNAQTEACICTILMPYLVHSIGLFSDGTIVGVTKNGILGLYAIDLQKNCASELDQQDLRNLPHFQRCRKLCTIQKEDGTKELFLLIWTTEHHSAVYRITKTKEQMLQLTKYCSTDELTNTNVILRDMDETNLPGKHIHCALFCGSQYQQFQSNFFILQTEDGLQYLYQAEEDTEINILRQDALDNYNGVTSGTFFRYQGKLYAAAATYSYLLLIFAVHDVTNARLVARCVHDTPLLDVKAAGNLLFAAGANGKVFQWELHTLLPEQAEPIILHCQEENVIFENISGFYMNHVRFSQSQKDWNASFQKKIEQYAENT